jgi:MarR family transcriptional regulator for hemolysin
MASTASARRGAPRKRQGRSTLAIYREGGTTPEIAFTLLLVLTGRRWRSLLDEHLRPIEQSAARMEALAAIVNSPPLPAQVDIAKRLRIEGPTLTRMLDTLEADGLVERLADPGDRRTKQLRVTGAGEAALEQIFNVADQLRARLLDGIEPARVAAMNEFFAGLLGRLDSGLPPPGDG